MEGDSIQMALPQHGPPSASKRGELYSAFEADVRGLIAHIGNTSGLILDPDLDSYYLMDTTLVAFPQTQTRLRELRNVVRGLEESKSLDAKARVNIALYAAQLKEADVDRMSGDFDTNFKEDANFNGTSPTLKANLQGAWAHYAESNKSLLVTLDKLVQAGDSSTLPALEAALDQTISDSYALEGTSIQELDRLLDARVANRYRTLAQGSGGMLVAILCSGLFAFFSIRHLRRDLAALQHELKDSSERLLVAGNENGEIAKWLSDSAGEQAWSLEETISASSQINSLARENASQVKSTTTLMQEIANEVTTLRESARSLNASMQEVSSSNKQISGIVEVIRTIANQTNLLALNAAIEAARAGDAGLGFSVVADEVRSLARNCGASAQDIAGLIETSISRTKASEAKLSEVVLEIETIAKGSKNVSNLIVEISESEQEQSRGIDTIATSIARLQKLTEQTAAKAQSSVQTGDKLWQDAEGLKSIVDHLAALTGVSDRAVGALPSGQHV